ncbi:MAG: F0F1 ATP synthase subunit A [Anaerolineales bacterium]
MKNNRILGIPNRYFVLALIILGIVFHYVLGIQVISPHVLLPAERFSPDGFLTNTLVATIIADVLIILMALAVRRAATSGNLVPRGLSGAVEALLEVLYNLTESTAGKYTRRIFPWFATITLLVLTVNWMSLIPGVESIGSFQPYHVHIEDAAPAEDEAGDHAEDDHAEDDHSQDRGDFDAICQETRFLIFTSVSGDPKCSSAIVPYVRVASTDLNFTAAIAVISVVMTQVIGVQALGGAYFKKFWNTSTLFSKPIFGVIDFAVGLLEVVSEISKILSFSFRLFGNMFAGAVLLFVIGSLVPVFVQSVFLMLEFFVGLIQAIVFGMLTMTFMSQATQGHHGEEEHH